MRSRARHQRADRVEVIAPREVPLGGLRAMTVRRTLPSRQRSLIGAWCFVDHFGPDEVTMEVTPHPHTGLQTVSWLFTGEIEHRDSVGTTELVRPGELNLMTAGRGISHSEISTGRVPTLHGAQLWVALPEESRTVAPGFERYVPPVVEGGNWAARVFLGELFGSRSPVRTYTPLLGVEIVLPAGGEVAVPLDAGFEHGILLDQGEVSVEETELAVGDLAYLPPGAEMVLIYSVTGGRLLLLGGPPFADEIVMWWNFIGRADAEIRAFREAWQRQVADGAGGQFGVVPGGEQPIPAPPMPNARLKPRRAK